VTSEVQQQQLVVTIDAEGNLSIDRQPTTLETLDAQIQSLLTAGNTPTVVINADTNVSHGKVVAVMDRLRTIPGVRLAIATQRP
jgi:biopolymer transport protein ExbD